jgi:hypothetical protein
METGGLAVRKSVMRKVGGVNKLIGWKEKKVEWGAQGMKNKE